jgi:hypothetical protein
MGGVTANAPSDTQLNLNVMSGMDIQDGQRRKLQLHHHFGP